jgi:hypothetical protein
MTTGTRNAFASAIVSAIDGESPLTPKVALEPRLRVRRDNGTNRIEQRIQPRARATTAWTAELEKQAEQDSVRIQVAVCRIPHMPTESQLRDAGLRARIKQLVEGGQLPCLVPKHIAAGYGSGHVCIACDEQIANAQVEYEVQNDTDGTRLTFHFGCYVVWQLECARLPRDGSTRR